MKSRLAVSFLFILIASTFTSDAIADFKKLRSWAGEIYCSRAVEALGKNCAAANQPCEMAAISLDGKSLAFNSVKVAKLLTWLEARMQSGVFKIVGSSCRCAAFDFLRIAARQMHEALGLMHIQ